VECVLESRGPCRPPSTAARRGDREGRHRQEHHLGGGRSCRCEARQEGAVCEVVAKERVADLFGGLPRARDPPAPAQLYSVHVGRGKRCASNALMISSTRRCTGSPSRTRPLATSHRAPSLADRHARQGVLACRARDGTRRLRWDMVVLDAPATGTADVSQRSGSLPAARFRGPAGARHAPDAGLLADPERCSICSSRCPRRCGELRRSTGLDRGAPQRQFAPHVLNARSGVAFLAAGGAS